MSTSIDNRIVQMTFDNKQFEAEIKKSMNSLKDLDKTIKEAGTGNAGKGFASIFEKIKNGFSLSSIADSVETIKDRFSTWGIVGMTVIQNLTNSALNFAKRGLSAINEALFSGGWQRAANLEAAQFRLEAILGSAKQVKKVMEDVDWAVTGTAYGLDEAAVAASMFAATNVKAGNEMRAALRAVAGVASTFSVDFQQVSNIFTDAAARGSVMNDTFTRLSMQGVPALQVMAKALGKTTEEIKDMAKDGEISFAEFAKAMDDAYGKHAQDANKTFTGALANMKTALKRMTEPFFTSFRAGARDVFNTLRDGINEFGTGFKRVLPGFENFIKTISQGLVKIIQNLTKANYITTELGKRIKRPSDFKKLGIAITGTFKGIGIILGAIKKSFDDTFGGSTSKRLKSFIDIVFNIEESFLHWAKTQTIVTDLFTIFFKILKTGWDIIKLFIDSIKKVGDIFGDLSKLINPVVSGFRLLTTSVTDFIEVFIKALNELDLIGKIAKLIHNAAGVVKNLIDGLVDIVLNTIAKFVNTATDNINQLMDILIDIGIFGIIAHFTDFIKNLKKATKNAGDFIKTLEDSIDALAKLPKKIVKILNEVLKALKKWQKQLDAAILLEIAGAVLILAYALEKISKLDGKQIAVSLGAVAGVLTILFGALAWYQKFTKPLEQTGKTLKEKFFALFKKDELNSFGTAMIKFAAAIYILANAIAKIGELDTGGAIRGFVGVGLLMVMMVAVAKLLSTNTNILKEEKIRKGMLGLIFMAISVKIMADAIAKLAEIPWSELDNALTAMTTILGEVLLFSIFMSKSSKGLEGGASAKSFILLAVSMKIIASALGSLASIDWDGLQNALAAMGLVLFEIAMFSAAVSAMGGAKGGVALIAMAAGIYIISAALSNIANVPWESLNNGMTVLVTLLLTLTAVMLAANFGVEGAAAMVIMAAALNLLVIPLMVLSAIPIENLASALLALVTTMAVVGIAMGVFSAALGPMLVGALALTAASVSILIFAAALMALGAAFNAVGVGLTMIATGILAIYNVIKKILSDIVNFIGQCVASISEFLGLGQEEIETSGEKLTTTSGNLGANIANALKNALLKKIKGAFSSFKSGGLQLVNSLISGIKSKITNIPKAIHDGVNKAKEKVADFVSKFKTAGINIVKGIANGIKNGASYIFSAVGSIASQALKKFKAKLGIESPSKVFAEAARWIPEGIVVGINKTSNKVKQSVEDLASSTIDPLADMMAKAYSILENEDDFNPTITPVLDLSVIKKEAGGIGSLFGEQTMNLASSLGNYNIQSSQTDNMMNRLINKMDKYITSGDSNPTNISNTFTINGAENPEEFVNTFINTLNREMKMRAV